MLDHGVDPDVAGDGGYTTLHHLATDHCRATEHRVTRATLLLDAGASLDEARSAAQVDAARLGLPLGPHRACQTVPGTRRRPSGGGCRAVGNAFGVGHEGRASRDRRVAAFPGAGAEPSISSNPRKPSSVSFSSSEKLDAREAKTTVHAGIPCILPPHLR